MIKQIKNRLAAITIIGSVFIASVAVTYLNLQASDVVENKSVIEEQICETPMPEVSVNKVVTSTQETRIQKQERKEVEVYKNGWTTTNVNIRKNPNQNATVLTTFSFNTQISYTEYNNEWVKIKYNENVAYMAKDYVSNEECKCQEYTIPQHSDFKSYMGYTAITSKSSRQYQLQANFAYTGNYGIRQVDNRYCVALGSYFGASIGQYFDLVLENGTIIPCIVGDEKANKDTDSNNLFTSHNGCMSEFVVDTSALVESAKNSGNISSVCDEWKSPVVSVRVYETNVFNLD